MKKFQICVLITLFAFSALTFAADPNSAPKANEDAVAVTVNGVNITESQIQAEIQPQLQRIAQQLPPQFLEQYKRQLRKPAIENIVAKMLLDQEIQKQGVAVTEDEVNAKINDIAKQQGLTVDDLKELIKAYGKNFEDWKKQMNFEKGLAYEKLFEPKWQGKVGVTEQEAKDFYDKNKNRYENPEQVQASHILISTRATDPNSDPNQFKADAKIKAQDILKQLKDGADFAQLAKENSDDPGSGQKGGELGYFPKGKMVKPFEDAAFSLEPGQISDLVESQFGYHIIKVLDKKEASTTSFEEAKPQIEKMVEQQKRETIARDFIESLKKDAKIVYTEPLDADSAVPGAPPVTN